MSTTRTLLDCLGRDSLVRLVYDRGLPTSRENDERRETLARSYRGDVEALIHDLSRSDLVEVFRQLTFSIGDVESFLSNPMKYRHDELRAFATRAFAGRRVRIVADFQAVAVEDESEVEVQPVDAEVDDSEDPDETPDVGGQTDASGDARPFRHLTKDWSRPRLVSRILRRLHGTAPERLRSIRFQELIRDLKGIGIEACLATDPESTVLDEGATSPGIAGKLRLRLIPDASVPDDSELGDAYPLLVEEKVARLGIGHDSSRLYYIKGNDVWSVPRPDSGQPQAKATKVAVVGSKMDYDAYVYFLDGDGDLARRPRDGDGRNSVLEAQPNSKVLADAHLTLLGWAVIHSDGVVDKREVDELYRVLSSQERQVDDDSHAKNISAMEAAIEIAKAAPLEAKQRLIQQLFDIATADGALADEELGLLTLIEERLVVDRRQVAAMAEQWRSTHVPIALPRTRSEELIGEILGILQTTTQWQG